MTRFYTRAALYLLILLLCNISAQSQPGAPQKQQSNYPSLSQHIQTDTLTIKKEFYEAEALMNTHPDSAIALFEKALTQSENMNYARGAKAALRALANMYAANGMYERFLNTFQHSLAVCLNSNKLIPALPIVFDGMGYVSMLKGMYEEAASYYYKAIFANEKLSLQVEMGVIYNNLGSVLPHLSQSKQAFFYLDKAEAIAQKEKDYYLWGNVIINKGFASMNENTDDALNYFHAALKLAKTYNLPSVECLALTNIALLYNSRGNPKALSYLQQAYSHIKSYNPYDQNFVLTSLGRVYYDAHNYERAEHFLLEALDMAQKLNLGRDLLEAHKELANIYAERNDISKAYSHLQIYSSLNDSLRKKGIENNVSQLEVKYRTAQKDKEILSNGLRISQQQNDLKQKNIWIGSISGISFLFILISAGLYRIYKHKQSLQSKQIHILQQQQTILQGEQAIYKQNYEIEQLKAIMKGEEKERTRIARELHDGIVSQLLAVKLNVSLLSNRKEENIKPDDLHNVLRQLEDATKDLRKTAHNLIPDILLQEGLTTATLAFCEQIEKNTGLEIDFQTYGAIPRFDSDVELSIYRIVQELIQNILKHANAKQAIVQISHSNNLLSITVEDNGKGFVHAKNKRNGTGLNNIQLRIKTLNGHMDLVSKEGTGTTVDLEFKLNPLENNTEDVYKNSYS